MSLVDQINADVDRRVARFEAAVAEIVAVPDARLVALAGSLTDEEYQLITDAVNDLEELADDDSSPLDRMVPHWQAIFDKANGSAKHERQIEAWRKRLVGLVGEDRAEEMLSVVAAAQPYYLVPEALDAPTAKGIASVLARLGVKP